jgi:hypothetical protein
MLNPLVRSQPATCRVSPPRARAILKNEALQRVIGSAERPQRIVNQCCAIQQVRTGEAEKRIQQVLDGALRDPP